MSQEADAFLSTTASPSYLVVPVKVCVFDELTHLVDVGNPLLLKSANRLRL
jgi:hypothetical protein